ncbi:MAG: hypothetical protein ACYCUI_02255 [Vulcanimicrobiaceae bacterium]
MTQAFSRRHWIPPGALVFGQLAHGASWLLLLWIATRGSLAGVTPAMLAWVHLVALGWFTMAALAILIHALPGFTEVTWEGERLARAALWFFGAGSLALVVAFLTYPAALGWAALSILLGIALYLLPAYRTLGKAMRGEGAQRAIARATGATFAFLILTALAGAGLAALLGGWPVPAWIASLPAAHAQLGLFGWLSLLIFGVSARTIAPIAGGKSRFRWMHVAVGVLALLGVPLLAIGLGLGSQPLVWLGGTLFAASAIVYAIDIADCVFRATVAHRPPQAFVLASVTWLLVSLAAGAGVLLGEPWRYAYVFLLLIGWVGQMVNAHAYHIGIRLLSTLYRGDDDETPPGVLLDARLSWISFAAFQAAVAVVAVGLARYDPALASYGAAIGFGGWIAMVANVGVARRRAAHGAGGVRPIA